MINKNAQITFFIIMGLVILFLFGLTMFVSNMKAEEKAEKNINKVTIVHADTSLVKDFTTQCLDSVSKEAIELLGAQGGFLYSYQVEGLYRYDPNFSEEINLSSSGVNVSSIDSNVNITYAIRREKGQRGKNLEYPISSGEKYPYGENFYVTPVFANIPSLCEEGGVNQVNISSSGQRYSCETFSGRFSIQSMLQKYIENRTYGCLDFTAIIDKKGYFIDYDYPNVTVFMNQDSVTVIMDMEVVVKLIDNSGQILENSKSVLTEFKVDIPVRLKQVHELAWHLLEKEAGNIFYNIESPSNAIYSCNVYDNTTGRRDNTTNCIKEGMKITHVKNESKDYSIISITDNYSSVSSNIPFVFNLLIRNRNPSLDIISYKRGDSSAYGTYLQSRYSRTPMQAYFKSKYPEDPNFDIIVDYDSELIIIPYAIDPDEDFNIQGDTIMGQNYIYASNSLIDASSIYHHPGTAIQTKDRKITINDKTLVGTYDLSLTVKDRRDLMDNIIIKTQIRCVDPNIDDYPHSISPSLWVNPTTGVVIATEFDQNISNDCCDEKNGFRWHNPGHSCGLCKRCDSIGNCELKAGDSVVSLEDCGPCRICAEDPLNPTKGICAIADNVNENQCSAGQDCCGGSCQSPKNLDDPQISWTSCTNAHLLSIDPVHSMCWSSGVKVCYKEDISNCDPNVNCKILDNAYKDCIKNHLVNKQYLDGPQGTCSTTKSCDKGRCS